MFGASLMQSSADGCRGMCTMLVDVVRPPPGCLPACPLQLDTEVMMHVSAAGPGGSVAPLPSPALYLKLLAELDALAGSTHLGEALEEEVPSGRRATTMHCCLEVLLGQVR